MLVVNSLAQKEFKQRENNDVWEFECKQFVMIGQWNWSVTNQVSFNPRLQLHFPYTQCSSVSLPNESCLP